MRVLAALLLVSSIQGADWIRARSDDVEILTDASEKTAREAIRRLAQLRALLPKSGAAAAPLRIYLFASEREYRHYAPSPSASGFYHSGFDRDIIAAPAGAALGRDVIHEFVHFALHTPDEMRPAWLEEGLAEYYSNAEFRRDGVRLGAAIREHVELLKSAKPLTDEELEIPHQDPIFYAQSWARVRAMRGEATVPLPAIREPQLRIDRLSALDAQLLHGELALLTGHLSAAQEIYLRAEREHPESPKAVAGLAALAEAEGDRERAKALFEKSLAMDDRNADAWLQYALVRGEEPALRKAAELNPDLGEAQLLLGVRATDEGRIEEALERLQRAVRLLPRKSYAWYSLAFAQEKAGDPAGARVSVELALLTARAPEQTAMAPALKDALGHD
jgi:tetratricopeptide (TPR) repeat protein